MAVGSGDPVVLALGADGLPVALPVTAPGNGDPVVLIEGADGKPVAVKAGGPVTTGDVGVIVLAADGKPVFVKIGSEVNPCEPNTEMLATVTGTSGTITWCGETWVLPDESGVEKSVCGFRKSNQFFRTYGGDIEWYIAYEYWADFAQVAGQRLDLRRRYVIGKTFPYGGWGRGGASNYAKMFLPGTFIGTNTGDVVSFEADPPVPDRPVLATQSYQFLSLGVWTSVQAAALEPLYTDYRLTDDFFDSYTTGGVTYSWRKGQGWD